MVGLVDFKREEQVDDLVKNLLNGLGLVNGDTYNIQSSGSGKLNSALTGASKTVLGLGSGRPDLHVEGYSILVLIEDKLHVKKLVAKTGGQLKMDTASVRDYAVNGAVYYAQKVISSGKYDEVIAIGVAGDNEENFEIQAYYVYGKNLQPKLLTEVKTLDFLQNATTFKVVADNAKLTDAERHKVLIDSRASLNKHAKGLNRLMNNHSINTEQRVVYIAGCLLAMQDVHDEYGVLVKEGLTPKMLTGSLSDTERDGAKIVAHIQEFLDKNGVNAHHKNLQMSTFRNAIATDTDRDKTIELDKEVGKIIDTPVASLNKQVFTFIYEHIFKAIDTTRGHLDIMGEMYSEFLKYAFGDGKDIGIVLTPPYVTRMMTKILNITLYSKVMDLATGSAGFLISSREEMIQDVERSGFVKGSTEYEKRVEHIQKYQLLGVELDAKMFVLASANMLLRGDTTTTIEKGSSFNQPPELYDGFGADRLLLNPPFSFRGNGMPFIQFGLDHMVKGGLAAIIVQDSAGSGKATAINKEILKKHTLLASIKMPGDLFQPNAGVQTSIYVFLAGTPHDVQKPVKFIDFRNDGYKRTGRGLTEISNPTARYEDIIQIYKSGSNASKLPGFHKDLWNLDETYVEDFITLNGDDWNFEQHQQIDATVGVEDFNATVGEYVAWEVTNLLTRVNAVSKEQVGE